MADLDAIIDELYGLPLAQFVARRNALAKGAPDAVAIRALTKPSAAAWAVNLLARADELGEVLVLEDRMRAATPVEQRALGGERRERVAAAVRAAADLAEAAGHPVSPSVLQGVEVTLQAAVLDAAAAAAAASGRLVRAIEPGGFGGVDLDGAVAGEIPAPRPPAVTDTAAEDARARRAREIEAARREAADAATELERAEAERNAARAAVDDAEERLADAERIVEALRSELSDRDAAATAADRQVREAERRARRAAAALD